VLLVGVPVLLAVADSAAQEDAGEDGQACEAEGTCGAPKGSSDDQQPADTPPFVCDFVEKLDFYERLGVTKDADDRSLKKAYRKVERERERARARERAMTGASRRPTVRWRQRDGVGGHGGGADDRSLKKG
jgi:hypothetical protein